MSTSFKSIAGRGLYFLLGVVLLVASALVFIATFSGKTARSHGERKTEKSFLYTGVVLAIASLGTFSIAFSKKKEWNAENEAIKPTGNKINNNPEVSLKLEKFQIKRLSADSTYKCIKSSIIYRGEEKVLTVYLADEADYDKIAHANSINISGELTDEVWSIAINNAKLNMVTSTMIT